MDLKQLRYFIAVAEAGSFTAAAEQLHITQPPLSRQIQLLEDRLQVTLIERSARPICLTQAGKLFYEQASQLLHRLQQIEEATTKLGQSEQSTLRIGFVASTLYGGLPILIRMFRDAYPQVKMHFSELTSLEQIQALKSGRIDVGIGRVRVYDAAISRVVLREEPLALAYSPHNEIAKTISESVNIEVLHGQELIDYPSEPRPSFADQVLTNSMTNASAPPRSSRSAAYKQHSASSLPDKGYALSLNWPKFATTFSMQSSQTLNSHHPSSLAIDLTTAVDTYRPYLI